jgi:hypothetical protein
MSNTQGPFGAVQIGTASGMPNFAQAGSGSPYRISSGYGTAIGFGDLVTLVSGATPTGYINRWVNGSGTATFQVAGVFYGCRYYSTSQRRMVWNNYWPGSDATGDVDAFVCDDPSAQFKIQANLGPITQASLGTTADAVMGTVNTTTGLSAMALDAPSTSNPSTLPFKIVNVVLTPPGANGTDITTAYNNVIVAFNNQLYKNLVTVHS